MTEVNNSIPVSSGAYAQTHLISNLGKLAVVFSSMILSMKGLYEGIGKVAEEELVAGEILSSGGSYSQEVGSMNFLKGEEKGATGEIGDTWLGSVNETLEGGTVTKKSEQSNDASEAKNMGQSCETAGKNTINMLKGLENGVLETFKTLASAGNALTVNVGVSN